MLHDGLFSVNKLNGEKKNTPPKVKFRVWGVSIVL